MGLYRYGALFDGEQKGRTLRRERGILLLLLLL